MPVVEIYQRRNYLGTGAQLDYGRIGDVAPQTGVPNDSISSIKVGPFTKVTLYTDRYFAGRSLVINGPVSVPNLSEYTGDMEDRVSSILIERVEPSEAEVMMCCTGQTTSGCAEFQHGTPLCKSVIASHCAKNITDPFCKAWCKQNPEMCDNTVIAYCQRNPTDPYCSCINSNAAGIANPKCVDRNCITSGYMTTSMRDTPCPAQVDCRMYVALSNSGVNIASQVPIQQNCGDIYDGSRATTPIVTEQNSGSRTTVFIIVIAVIFILIVFIAIIAAASHAQTDRNEFDLSAF